ncbi:type II toxin-antitoxin system PemK/MazF family toxin [Candidatus Woesearchaeota archaeon]|nr:type II toxin-antitoxin system PemK/MazF family toxin [Candidatus Woesearchaeota archaeon]
MMQQDILWVRYPFSDLGGQKVRPAIVISNNWYNQRSNDLIVCAVTSNLNIRTPSIVIEQSNLTKGELPIKSKVRADKIMQLDKSLVIKPFARINDTTFDALTEEILKLIKRS